MKNNNLFSKNTLFQLIKYATTGLLSSIISISILYTFTELLGVYYLISSIWGFFVAVSVSYVLDRFWTFKVKGFDKFKTQYIQFVIIIGISLALNTSLLFVLVEYLDLYYIFAQVILIITLGVFNFLAQKLWTFNVKFIMSFVLILI